MPDDNDTDDPNESPTRVVPTDRPRVRGGVRDAPRHASHREVYAACHATAGLDHNPDDGDDAGEHA